METWRTPADEASRMREHGVASGARSLEGEQALWARFVDASAAEDFCGGWLALQCRKMSDVTGGLVLLGPPDAGPYVPVAVWPQLQRSMEHLTPTAERAVRERRGVVDTEAGEADNHRVHLAYPIEISGKLHGVVVVEARTRPEPELQAMLRELHWGTAWLEVLFRRQTEAEDAAIKRRVFTVLDLVAGATEEPRFQGAATAFVTELATRLSCDRVSIGFLRGRHARVQAISHSATFVKEMHLVQALGAAMDEAIHQECAVVFPQPTGSGLSIQPAQAHEELARHHRAATICTVPIRAEKDIIGALTIERMVERTFDDGTVELCESLAGLAGPILALKRDKERWLVVKAAQAARGQVGKLIGPEHLLRKFVLAGLVALVVFFSVATGDYRIAAETVIEGAVQRSIVAPFEGYIADASVRAGDIVQEGQLLSRLDDKDLTLERVRWATQRAQYTRERREANAKRERSRSRILAAQIRQAEAQVALLDEQLARTRLLAPFDGLVVSGDLSQSLGAPVQRGDVLFELAPLDEYRIVLRVEDWDIADVAVGQQGELTLAAIPDETLAFTVTQLTPVTVAEEGQTYFRVEAQLAADSSRLRPGMEGVGKIDIDVRKLIWIWTRDMLNWLRLRLWSWWPP